MTNSDYQIITDATADLSPELMKELGIDVIPMQLVIDEDAYTFYPDEREITAREIYARLRGGSNSHTNSINLAAYEETFVKYLEKGKDIVYICFSSGLSGSIQAAVAATEELKARFPERTIDCLDSLSASAGQGLLTVLAARQQQNGLSQKELVQWVTDNRLHLCHWFTVDDLSFLHRGGRVSAASAVLGGALQIKPILHVDDDGHLILMEKSRGRRRSLERLVEHMLADGTDLSKQEIFIGHADDIESAQYVADTIRARTKVGSIRILTIGPVIGSHSGPGTIALFYLGTKR